MIQVPSFLKSGPHPCQPVISNRLSVLGRPWRPFPSIASGRMHPADSRSSTSLPTRGGRLACVFGLVAVTSNVLTAALQEDLLQASGHACRVQAVCPTALVSDTVHLHSWLPKSLALSALDFCLGTGLEYSWHPLILKHLLTETSNSRLSRWARPENSPCVASCQMGSGFSFSPSSSPRVL